MKEITSCPICQHEKHNLFLEVKDHMITKELFSIVLCEKCGFHFTNPIPEEDKIGAYYKSEDYISHSSSSKGFINFLYNIVRNKTLRDKVKWVSNVAKGDDLLDVGSGTGHFLKVAKKKGFKGFGLEPDPDARAFAKKTNNISSYTQEDLYQLKPSSVDVITMWHVMEHVCQLNKDIAAMHKVLRPTGHIFVAVPNMESYDAQHYESYWAAYDVPRHLYHFKKNDINKLMDKHGFNLKKIIPMKYDAFYVSMLSEKYKGNFSLKGFFTGLKSNMKAKKYGYSSQVYVFEKK